MKKLLTAVALVLILSGCAKMNMAITDRPAEIYAKPDKALLIIVRDTFMGAESVFHYYLDGQMIGDTIGKSWFVAEVSPGTHYVVAMGGITTVTRMAFQPGKIYSLRQNVLMGAWLPQPGSFWPISQVETKEFVKTCSYLEYAYGNGARDLDPAFYESVVDRYHNELKSNPDTYSSSQDYAGF